MEELIAKRYVKALKTVFTNEELAEVGSVFDVLAQEFKNEKYTQIIDNPHIAKSKKLEILLDAVKSVKSIKLNNLMHLLVDENRVGIIPAIALVIKKELAKIHNSYNGTVYSSSEIDAGTLTQLSEGISKKIDSKVTLDFVKNDFDGIKMEVEDLGIEIDFSKSRINTQMIEYILKAI